MHAAVCTRQNSMQHAHSRTYENSIRMAPSRAHSIVANYSPVTNRVFCNSGLCCMATAVLPGVVPATVPSAARVLLPYSASEWHRLSSGCGNRGLSLACCWLVTQIGFSRRVRRTAVRSVQHGVASCICADIFKAGRQAWKAGIFLEMQSCPCPCAVHALYRPCHAIHLPLLLLLPVPGQGFCKLNGSRVAVPERSETAKSSINLSSQQRNLSSSLSAMQPQRMPHALQPQCLSLRNAASAHVPLHCSLSSFLSVMQPQSALLYALCHCSISA